jgi:hypothetical protein
MATHANTPRSQEFCLPSVDRLSLRQIRGADCVFCGITLCAETAVDLGEQVRPDGSGRWFPRACKTHPWAAAAAARAIPAAVDLVPAQRHGWACVWCGAPLTDETGAHHVGYARGRPGVHNLDCEAWSCTRCKEEWKP